MCKYLMIQFSICKANAEELKITTDLVGFGYMNFLIKFTFIFNVKLDIPTFFTDLYSKIEVCIWH